MLEKLKHLFFFFRLVANNTVERNDTTELTESPTKTYLETSSVTVIVLSILISILIVVLIVLIVVIFKKKACTIQFPNFGE